METFRIVLQYLLAILGFSLIMLVHEFGHYIFAKLNRIHVIEFFIGFGPKIIKFVSKRSGTMYGISAIPLGGYNRILGYDSEEKVSEDKKDMVFYNKPFYKKFLVIIGGGFFNILLTILLIGIYLSMGVFTPTNVINYIQPDSPAAIYGFEKDDRLIAVNDKKITSWEEFSALTKSNPGKTVTYTILRKGNEIKITTKLETVENQGFLGISPQLVKQQIGFLNIIKESFKMTWDISVSYVKLFGMLFSGKIPFSEARPVSPIGVISIFQQSVSMGFQNFILFVALVSLLLAFGNFLPILPVDGGHIIIIIAEAIKRKPIPRKAVEIYNTVGMVLVISLFVIGFIFDIVSPFKLPKM